MKELGMTGGRTMCVRWQGMALWLMCGGGGSESCFEHGRIR